MSRKKKNILQIIIPIFAVIFFLSFGVITHGAMYQNINPTGDQTVAPGAANFESGEVVWVNNAFVVRTRAGGTGVIRGLQLTTGANAGVYIDSSGNVGIGTTGPNAKLEILSPTIDNYNDGISFGYSSLYKNKITGFFDGTNPTTGSAMQFKVANDAAGGNTAVMTLKGSGNVGIGTTNPTQRLHIGGSGVNLQIGDSGGAAIYFNNTSNNISYNSNQFQFNTTQTLGFTFNGGNVGIGTTSPGYKLDVVGGGQFSQPVIVGTPTASTHAATKSYVDSVSSGWAANYLYFQSTNATSTYVALNAASGAFPFSSAAYWATPMFYRSMRYPDNGTGSFPWNNFGELMLQGTSYGNGYNRGISFITTPDDSTPPSIKMRIDPTGNVGIGTTVPQDKLDVNGTTRAKTLNITGGDGGGNSILFFNTDAVARPSYINNQANSDLYLSTNNSIALTIKNTSNVGIGTTGPGYRLSVNGNSAGNDGINIANAGAGSAQISFDNPIGTQKAAITWVKDTDLRFYTAGGGNVMSITNTGNVGIGTTSPLTKLDITGASNGGIHLKQGAQIAIAPVASGSFSNGLVFENSGSTHAWGMGYTVGGYFGLNYFDGSSAYSNLLTVNTSGNVGIATTTPSYKLDVGGTSQFSQPVIVGTPTASTHATTKSYVDSMFTGSGQWTTNGGLVYLTSTTQNVGIGTTAPGAKLQVGSGTVSDTGFATRIIGSDGNQVALGYGSFGSSIQGRSSTDVNSNLALNPWGGNVGIGTTVPQAALDFGGAPTKAIQTQYLVISGNNSSATDRPYIRGMNNHLVINGGGTTSGGILYLNYTGDGATGDVRIRENLIVSSVNSYFTSGNVGIGTPSPSYTLDVNGYGSFNQPVLVGTPTAAGHAATKSYVDSIVGGGAGTGSFATLSVTGTSTLSGNLWLTGAMYSNLNMNGKNISGVNKLTVTTLDPLYEIEGAKYATYASAIAGGVREEYVGKATMIPRKSQITNNKCQTNIKYQNSLPKAPRQPSGGDQPRAEKLNNSDFKNSSENLGLKNYLEIGNCGLEIGAAEYQYVIDFNDVKRGSDLWVWYHAIDFSKDNVEVLATAYGVPVPIAYTIEDNKIIFRTDNIQQTTNNKEIEFSYRLVGKRFDWRQWPTYAKDQSEPAGLIVK